MKKILLIIILILLSVQSVAYCHPGGRDLQHGHKDTNNVSELGDYHFHCYGAPAHLHEDGVCPYKEVPEIKKEKIPTRGIILKNENFKLGISYNMDDCFEVIPRNSVYKVIKWESDNNSVLEIEENKAVGIKNGKAVLAVQTDDGYTAEFSVTVGTGVNEKPYKIAAVIAVAITAAVMLVLVILHKIKA